MDAERGEKVTPAALAMVKGTALGDPYAWTFAADWNRMMTFLFPLTAHRFWPVMNCA
ncbi:hypothetical protein HAT86_12075 [Roseovarius gahaiensis]|uniref:Uncharacterized protein n=1 Tax=Roseovarius gahaiensis TaxID=2716691 RepID=A0A967BHK8_9RHOB|nr:hypothetical protein [Roseovarius gahaiensis]NHQ75193.1 hypothetical protein [Roseovarius gahaiensis]